MSDLLKIVGLTEAQFNALHENGSVTINGTTLHYSEDILYLVETNESGGGSGTAPEYVLPTASSATLGGIKTGYTTSGKNYKVQVDNNGNAYVNVPWENTTYSLSTFGITATAAELNYTDGVTSNIQTQLNGKLSTGGGTISGDLTLYAASGDSPKLRLQRGDNTGTITDWNINVVSGALNFNTVATSGSTAEKTVVSIGYNGQFNVNGSIMENSVALSDKYLTGITKAQVTTALGYTPPTTNTTYSVATASTAGLVKPVSVITKPTLNSVTTTAGKYYQVQMSSDGNMFVNVPWSAGTSGSYLPLSGGTITGDVTMQATSNASSANFTWGTVNSNTPYFGFASDQTDGTFVWSLKGTNYASGLAIGGGSGNLLWKGTRVATTADIPAAYTLPLAASGTRGGVQIGYGESGANLALKLSSEKGYVTLTKSAVTTALGYTPPTTNTTYSVATASTAGLVKPVSVITKPTLNSVTATAGKYYQVQMSSDGNMFVNVPWSAGSTSLSSLGITATATELNYTDGVTSNIQTQLNGKLSTTGKAASATVADRSTKVKSIDTSASMATCRVALLLDTNGMDNDDLIKTADLKYNVIKKSLIENGVALSDKYGMYKHDITFETSLGEGWVTIVDNHATAYNDDTFREKYPNGWFNIVGATNIWDAIWVGQLDVRFGEFYGVISYDNGQTYPVMEGVFFAVISDTVAN